MSNQRGEIQVHLWITQWNPSANFLVTSHLRPFPSASVPIRSRRLSLFPSERVSSCARSRALSLNQFLTAINSCCVFLLLFVVDFKIKYTYVVFFFFIQMMLYLDLHLSLSVSLCNCDDTVLSSALVLFLFLCCWLQWWGDVIGRKEERKKET